MYGRTQNSLLSIKCDRYGKNFNVENEIVIDEEKSQDLIKFSLDYNNSVNPLVNLWRENSNSSSFVQVYDVNKSKGELYYPKTEKIKLHDFCQVDKIGLTFAFIDHKDCYLLDPREKNLIKSYLKIGDNSRYFRLNHGIFKQGRLLNIILDGEILCYDLRNPGESILSIEHFTQCPPFISTRVEDLQDLGLDTAINKKVSINEFENFFNNFIENPTKKFSASSSIETEADIFKSSHLLYSPCHNGEILLINNFQPLRKKVDVKNTFNYEVIKEINNSLSRFNLFNGLTRFRRWPTKLYCSNYESDLMRIRGANLIKNGDKMYSFVLDNEDSICFQCFDFVDQDFNNTKKKDSKGFINYKIRYLKINYQEKEDKIAQDYESNFLLKKKKLKEIKIHQNFSEKTGMSEEDMEEELEDIKSYYDHREFIDMRKTATGLINKEELEEHRGVFEEGDEVKKKSHNYDFSDNKVNKENIEICMSLANDKFYMTEGLMNFLKENWSDEEEDEI